MTPQQQRDLVALLRLYVAPGSPRRHRIRRGDHLLYELERDLCVLEAIRYPPEADDHPLFERLRGLALVLRELFDSDVGLLDRVCDNVVRYAYEGVRPERWTA